MPDISVVINCDTRSQRDEQSGLFNGVVNLDFLTDGIFNKIKFFDGFDIEVIVYVDEHNPVDEKTLDYLRAICSCVVIRKHTNENSFNDYNYLSALSLARGKYIAHNYLYAVLFLRQNRLTVGVYQNYKSFCDNYDFVAYDPPPELNLTKFTFQIRL